MPLYEYQCPKCGRFELIRKFSDPALETCPTCGSAIQKLMSAPAIQFKGTGWYVTDYARKDGKPGTGASGEAKGGESKAGEVKGEGRSGEGKAADAKPSDSAAAKKDAPTSKASKPSKKD